MDCYPTLTYGSSHSSAGEKSEQEFGSISDRNREVYGNVIFCDNLWQKIVPT